MSAVVNKQTVVAALKDIRLTPITVNIVQYYLSRACAVFSGDAVTFNPRETEHLAHDLCVVDPPLIAADCAPFSVVVDFNPALTVVTAVHQTHCPTADQIKVESNLITIISFP